MLNGVNPSYPKPKSHINIVLEFQASVIKQKKINEWHPVQKGSNKTAFIHS